MKRLPLLVLLPAALCCAPLATPALAQDDTPPPKTQSSIKRAGFSNGSAVFTGTLKTVRITERELRVGCRRNRKVELYRTVNSGFGPSTRRVASGFTGPANGRRLGVWEITARRSGTYFVRVPATDICPAGESRKLNYTRFLG